MAHPPSYPLSETLTHAGQRNWTVSLLFSSLLSCFFPLPTSSHSKALFLIHPPAFPIFFFSFSFHFYSRKNSKQVLSSSSYAVIFSLSFSCCFFFLACVVSIVSLRSSSNLSIAIWCYCCTHLCNTNFPLAGVQMCTFL